MKKLILFFIKILTLCLVFGTIFYAKAQLIISEVYFAGTDERIEITNISNKDFSGVLTISGAKSSQINLGNIFIQTGASLLFGDKMDMVLDHSFVGRTGLGLSIYDTRDLAVELLYSGQTIDAIFASSDVLAEAKAHKASIQKIQKFITGDIFITTGSQNFSGYNIADAYVANPGKIYSLNLNYSTGNNQESGTINTGNISGEVCGEFNTKIKITEIFPGDEIYPAYIEIQALENFDGNVLLSGDALLSSIVLNTTLHKDDYLLISNIDSGWLSTLDTRIDPSFHLNKSGSQLLLYGQSRQLLDSAFVSFGTGNISYYQSSTGDCINYFDRKNNFSPGFSEELFVYISSGSLVYIEVEKIVEIDRIVYVETGCMISGDTITGATTSGQQDLTNGQFIQIVSIVYDPDGSDVGNEIVVLKSQVPYPVNIDHLRLHSLSRTTKNRIYGDLSANGKSEFVGNYRFPNTANCVELLSGNVILDTYCYDPADDVSTGETVDNDESGQDLQEDRQENNTMTSYKISIENLVYDVEGSDKDREQVTLVLEDDSSLPVLDVEALKEFKLIIGTRKTKLFYEDLNDLDKFSSRALGEKKTFTGNFRFPNTKNTCVSLIRNEHIFDTRCYEIPQEKKSEPENNIKEDFMPKTLSGDIQIISILPNPIGKDAGAEQIKLMFTSSEIQELILDNDFSLQINTQNKKISGTLKNNIAKIFTGNFSFPNNAACVSITYFGKIIDTFCYEKAEEGIFFTKKNDIISQLSTVDLSILQKTTFKKLSNKICLLYNNQTIHCKNYKFGKIYSASYDELRLYKNYIKTLNGYLSNNWPTLFFNSPLQYYQNLFKQAKIKLDAGEKTINIYGKIINIYDIESRSRATIFATPTEIIQRKILDQIIPESIRNQYYFWLEKKSS